MCAEHVPTKQPDHECSAGGAHQNPCARRCTATADHLDRAVAAIDWAGVSDTVLIAPSDLLDSLRAHHHFEAALTFPDSEVPAALEAILAQRPKLVALERLFAATSRGAALIERIRVDPRLSACEIRIVAHEAGAVAGSPPSAAAPLTPAAGGTAVLDEHGTRGAARAEMSAPIEIALDGRPAYLIDLSPGGAQVLTALALKPGQRVRLALPAGARPLRCSATVQWAKFEMPREGPRYRAGVKLLDADASAIAAHIDTHTR